MFSTFDFFRTLIEKKIGRVSKTTFFQGNSLSKTIFYGFLCLVFLKLWAETFVPWARKLFSRMSKVFVLFYGRIATFTFIKLKYVSFFSCIFFRLQSKFSRSPGLFFRAALTKPHSFFHSIFPSVKGSSSNYLFNFSIVFAIFTVKRTEIWPNFFNRLSERLWYFPGEKCEV